MVRAGVGLGEPLYGWGWCSAQCRGNIGRSLILVWGLEAPAGAVRPLVCSSCSQARACAAGGPPQSLPVAELVVDGCMQQALRGLLRSPSSKSWPGAID